MKNSDKKNIEFERTLQRCPFVFKHAGEVADAVDSIGFEDALQEIRIHLWLACDNYKPDSGVSLESFLCACSEMKRNELIRNEKSIKKGYLAETESLDSMASEGLPLLDKLLAESDEALVSSITAQDILRTIVEYLDSLKTDTARLVINYYMLGLTQKELAQRFHLSQATIHERIFKFRKSMDKRLKAKGYTDEEIHSRSLRFDPKKKS